MKVLFICTGNTCRSPMAEALLRHYLPELEVMSAGIYAANGAGANQHSITVLKEKNITVDHESVAVNRELLEWADIVLTMTQGHKSILVFEYPGFQHKIAALIEYVIKDGALSEQDIVDPYGGNIATYRETCMELERYIKLLVNKLELGEDGYGEETSF